MNAKRNNAISKAWDYFAKTLLNSKPLSRGELDELQSRPVATDEQLAALDAAHPVQPWLNELRAIHAGLSAS